MSRWLLLIIGVGLAAVAALTLLSEREPHPPAINEIDEESRRQLEEVIERAEQEEASKR